MADMKDLTAVRDTAGGRRGTMEQEYQCMVGGN